MGEHKVKESKIEESKVKESKVKENKVRECKVKESKSRKRKKLPQAKVTSKEPRLHLCTPLTDSLNPSSPSPAMRDGTWPKVEPPRARGGPTPPYIPKAVQRLELINTVKVKIPTEADLEGLLH